MGLQNGVSLWWGRDFAIFPNLQRGSHYNPAIPRLGIYILHTYKIAPVHYYSSLQVCDNKRLEATLVFLVRGWFKPGVFNQDDLFLVVALEGCSWPLVGEG